MNKLWALQDGLFELWLLESGCKVVKMHVELVHVRDSWDLAGYRVEVYRVSDTNSFGSVALQDQCSILQHSDPPRQLVVGAWNGS